MEKTMIKSIGVSVALLSIALLMSSSSAFARTGGVSGPNPGSTAQVNALASAVNSFQILAIWASPIYTGGDGGGHYDHGDGNNNGDGEGNNNGDEHGKKKGDDDDPPGPKPTPEPSTLLSFGAAILIGGGVLYSRRLRRNRK
jgi:hypothetical protein